MIKKLILFLFALILTAVSFPAFSAEPDMVNNPELWFETENIITEEITDYKNINGFYSYYNDTENHCFFLHISYTEINLKSENNEVKINFNISNAQHSYRFIVTENGAAENSSIKTAFSVSENFGSSSEQGQDIYIGIEFKNKLDIKYNNTLNFSIDVNGNRYDIRKAILLNYYNETADKTSTAASKSDKQPETEKSEKNKSTSEKEVSTKFKYTPSGSDSNSKQTLWNYEDDLTEQKSDEYNETIMNSSERNTIITDQNHAASFSPVSKALLAFAAAMILCGIVLILYCLFKPKKVINPESNGNGPTENDETC